ncbi:hypothetical protein [Nocardioides speluncae]|uniref:hypothetical protein n=1 Tax=Nocardioides speluncae TaxID=2670337 RepID=UPI00197CC622|nr:hypothetical protein [Nocardioides speluncae]
MTMTQPTGSGWVPVCRCGWKGAEHPVKVEAWHEGDAHLAETNGRTEAVST